MFCLFVQLFLYLLKSLCLNPRFFVLLPFWLFPHPTVGEWVSGCTAISWSPSLNHGTRQSLARLNMQEASWSIDLGYKWDSVNFYKSCSNTDKREKPAKATYPWLERALLFPCITLTGSCASHWASQQSWVMLLQPPRMISLFSSRLRSSYTCLCRHAVERNTFDPHHIFS